MGKIPFSTSRGGINSLAYYGDEGISEGFFVCHSPLSRMARNHLQEHITCIRKSLFDQGYLDEQFIQLEELQDDANPNFVEEVVTLYYNDSARRIRTIEQALNTSPNDFDKLDNYMYQFGGSCSSIGAKRVKNECSLFRKYCNDQNVQGCFLTFQHIKREHLALKMKLQTYFQVSL